MVHLGSKEQMNVAGSCSEPVDVVLGRPACEISIVAYWQQFI